MNRRRQLSGDARRVVAAQALRAFAYGLGALLLGTTLKRRGLSATEVGVVLGAVVAGTVATTLAVARWSDRIGRRRSYVCLYVALAGAGAGFALSGNLAVLILVAMTGTLSTDIIDNGPFTSLEQAMLATDLAGRDRLRGFGLYNAVAAAAGSLGALAGFCYTQFTDTYQEANGLLRADRTPKFPLDEMAAATRGEAAPRQPARLAAGIGGAGTRHDPHAPDD